MDTTSITFFAVLFWPVWASCNEGEKSCLIAVLYVAQSTNDDDYKNVKKTIGLISKTTTSHVHHAFLYISLPFLYCELRRENA